jgi:hypothetical protein
LGFEVNIWAQEAFTWPEKPGPHNPSPGSARRQSLADKPSEAQTPQEALTYIELLYKSGRMEDLAALLRRSAVFREAWLMLQQSSPVYSEAAEVARASAGFQETPGHTNFPVSSSDSASPSPKLNADQGLVGLKAATETGVSPEMPAASKEPGIQNHPVLAGKPKRPLATALKAYTSQYLYYSREKDHSPRFSLRV